MMTYKKSLFIFLIVGCCFLTCKHRTTYTSPQGYNLTKNEKFSLDNSLHEISGISFLNGNKDLFAIEDEDGKLYTYTPATGKTEHIKFGKKGDYEDVAVLNDQYFAVLRSDGSLFTFPVSETAKEVIDSVQEFKHLLPEGEYEGLAAYDGKLLALCKSCTADKGKKTITACIIQPDAGGSLTVSSSFGIDISMIRKKGEKEKFNPSCIAKNPVTNQWYIISSVNKLLLVLDEEFTVKEFYPLDPSIFNQPEGLTFDTNGDMYVSNEGGAGTADILLFRYQKQ
jgi:uncharacterized protein YjiK